MPRREWTQDDDARLVRMKAEGYTSRQIAVALSRTSAAVATRYSAMIKDGVAVRVGRVVRHLPPARRPPTVITQQDVERARVADPKWNVDWSNCPLAKYAFAMSHHHYWRG